MRSGAELGSEIERIVTCFGAGPAGVACLAPDGRILATNSSLREMVGRTEHELAGARFLDFFRPDDGEASPDVFDEQRRLGASFTMRGCFSRGPGDPMVVESHVSAVTDGCGTVEYLVVLVQDVTAQRSVEEQNDQLFRFPLALVFIAGLDGYFRRVSAGYERLLGWTEEELLSRPLVEFVHPDDVGTLGASLQEVAAGRAEVINQELRALCRDGTYRWLMGNYRPVVDQGLVYGMAIDVTERKRAEEALRESERRTRLILDTAYEAFVSMDAGGAIVEWNAEAERLFRWPRDEVIGRPLVEVIVPPRYRTAHLEGLARYHRTGEGPLLGNRVEVEGLRSDGSEVPVELTIAPLAIGDSVVFNAFLRDTTQRRRAEEALHAARAEAEAAREEAERASQAKTEFLSRMSHELRTPLNAILGFTQLLQMDNPRPEQDENLELIIRAGRHLLQLIEEILDVAGIEQGRLSLSIEPVHLDEVVREVIDLIRPLAAASNIGIWIEASQFDRLVLADRRRLQQVFLNLLSNAVKYNQHGGTVTVSCAPTSGGRLRVTVVDTGLGIPPEMMDRLFLPFERLGAQQTGVEGTGIGLSIARRLVELMGGEIGAVSEVGQGSTFWVEFDPAQPPPPHDVPAVGDTSEVLATGGGVRTVLYVEDNLANLRLVERIFAQRPSVRVVAAMQGILALDLAREHRPATILLDVHLPDIEGDEVLQRLQEDPETRAIPVVVVVSAEATPRKVERFLAAGARAYLTKPLDVQRFLELVDEILSDSQR